MSATAPITVYFDGYCPVCSREVAGYRRLATRRTIIWRDLAGSEDVLTGESFDLAAALTLLHVRDSEGRLQRGLEAHLCLWSALPGWHWLVWPIRRVPGLRPLLERAYVLFTRYRPGLRRRSQARD